jgi:biuret amidohydrolase
MQRAYGLEIPKTLEEVCDPRRMALLVYDMQEGIVRHVPEAGAFVARVVRVIEAARRAGVRVVFARHLSLPNELAGVFQLRTAMAWQRVERVADVRPLFLRGSPDFQFVPELTPLPSEAVFDKLAMSMFVGTPLELVLRDCGINAFAIVGAVTEIGIEPTSGRSPRCSAGRSALDRAHGEARDEAVQEQVEHQGDGDRDQDRRRLQRLPEEHVAADQLGGDAGGDDLLGGG